MGHGKSDRLYVTPAEHSGVYGQHSASSGKLDRQNEGGNFQPLSFDCCAISLQPWSNPVCCKDDGTIFELTNVVPFIKKYGVNPATGKPIKLQDLITLHFVKNQRNKYHDPVSFKEFGQHTNIVAIATTGNVYSHETIQQLNIKAKHMKDLINDQLFTKNDMITLQDPHNADQKDISNLHHVKNNLIVTQVDKGIHDDQEVKISAMGSAGALIAKLRQNQASSASVGKPVSSQEAALPPSATSKPEETDTAYRRNKGPQTHNATSKSTGMTAASFTSSSLTPRTKTERVMITDLEYMFEQIKSSKAKQKAYVRLSTNFGPLNLELHCEKAPMTCYNFISLCKQGKYDDTIFHRNIAGFMIQGGDPTGTGRGGESIWGQPFGGEHQVSGAFKHTGRGVLSMANSGPSTNGSQFFLTYRAVPHLDGKHTVFGRLVDGEKDSTLAALESVPTDKPSDRPQREIRILGCLVTQDPFEAFEKKLKRPTEQELVQREEKKRKREQDRTTWLGTELPPKELHGSVGENHSSSSTSVIGSGSSTIGKYLGSLKKTTPPVSSSGQKELGYEKKKKGNSGSSFGDFSSW